MEEAHTRLSNAGTDDPDTLDNTGKTVFTQIYDRPDPRDYYLTLGRHNYLIPDAATPVFQTIYTAYREARHANRLHITDIGCSYGINAALHKYGLSMSQLMARYAAKAAAGIDTQSLEEDDKRFFRSLEPVDDLVFYGLDVAANAIRYAIATRVLDDGSARNLEDEAMTPSEARPLGATDIIISTGAVGYVTEKTFSRVIDACGKEKPWLALFVLRQFRAGDIAEALKPYGYVCETLESALFPQRRFTDGGEQREALARLSEIGRTPTPVEEAGWYAANFVLMRPDADARTQSLEQMMPASRLPTASYI